MSIHAVNSDVPKLRTQALCPPGRSEAVCPSCTTSPSLVMTIRLPLSLHPGNLLRCELLHARIISVVPAAWTKERQQESKSMGTANSALASDMGCPGGRPHTKACCQQPCDHNACCTCSCTHGNAAFMHAATHMAAQRHNVLQHT